MALGSLQRAEGLLPTPSPVDFAKSVRSRHVLALPIAHTLGPFKDTISGLKHAGLLVVRPLRTCRKSCAVLYPAESACACSVAGAAAADLSWRDADPAISCEGRCSALLMAGCLSTADCEAALCALRPCPRRQSCQPGPAALPRYKIFRCRGRPGDKELPVWMHQESKQ